MGPQLSRRAHFPKDRRCLGAMVVAVVLAEHVSGDESKQESWREEVVVAKDTFSNRSFVADHNLTAFDTVMLSAINNSPSVNIPLACKGETRGRDGPRARFDMF